MKFFILLLGIGLVLAQEEDVAPFSTEATTDAITEAITEAIAETEAFTELFAETEAFTELLAETTTEVDTEPPTETRTGADTEPATEVITDATTESVSTTETPERQPCDGLGKLISRNGCTEHCWRETSRILEMPYFTTIAVGAPCKVLKGWKRVAGVCEVGSSRFWSEYAVCRPLE